MHSLIIARKCRLFNVFSKKGLKEPFLPGKLRTETKIVKIMKIADIKALFRTHKKAFSQDQ